MSHWAGEYFHDSDMAVKASEFIFVEIFSNSPMNSSFPNMENSFRKGMSTYCDLAVVYASMFSQLGALWLPVQSLILHLFY